MEAHLAELGFHHARIHRAHTHFRAEQVHAHPLRQCRNRMFGRAVDIPARIDLVSGDGADVDDVPAAARDHVRNDGPADVEQAFDIGVNHLFPIGQLAFVQFIQPAAKPRVIDQDVYRGPGDGQAVDGSLDGRLVTHIQLQSAHFDAVLRIDFGSQLFQAFEASRASTNAAGVRTRRRCRCWRR